MTLSADLDRLSAYMQRLANRLCRVRITCGDWQRVLTPSVIRSTTGGDGAVAVLLDPPYSTGHDLYAATAHGAGASISAYVREWCKAAPGDLRIALCGYLDEHDELLDHGWDVRDGKAGSAGYNTDPTAGRRERIWFSPACIGAHQDVLDFGASA